MGLPEGKKCRQPVDGIRDNPQIRRHFDEDVIRRLAASIAKDGLINPLTTCAIDGSQEVELIAGGQRLLAVKQLNWSEVDCLVYPPLQELQKKTIQLQENLQRKDLLITEEAQGYRDLLQINQWTAAQLSKAINVDEAKISRTQKVLETDPKYWPYINDGTLPPTTVVSLVRKHRDKARLHEALDALLAKKNGRTSHRSESKSSVVLTLPGEIKLTVPPELTPDVVQREVSGFLKTIKDELGTDATLEEVRKFWDFEMTIRLAQEAKQALRSKSRKQG